MQTADLYDIFLQHPAVQTDTRKLREGDLYFALKGPNFNGNAFARQALDNGAAYAMVDEDPGFESAQLIRTGDVLQALQDLALYHRQQFDIPFIAITGSNGKTTTKELVHAVLSSTFTTYTTRGNLNNHIGIPLTLLSVQMNAEMAVIEMGANHQQEIAGYCRYVLPTHGLITNCGKAHLEGFGGIEGVRKGKGELYDFIREKDGAIFMMNDYDYLQTMSRGIRQIITYGTGEAMISGQAVAGKPMLEVQLPGMPELNPVRTNLVGDYNLPNVLAAIAVGRHFGVADHRIKTALEAYVPSNSRSQLMEKNGNRIILDAYNANPTSMRAAIENMAGMEGSNKVLMLGAMMELGAESLHEHQGIIDLINRYHWKDVVLVGGDFCKLKHPFHSMHNSEEAAAWAAAQKFNDALLLVKGSRSMQMEKVLEAL